LADERLPEYSAYPIDEVLRDIFMERIGLIAASHPYPVTWGGLTLGAIADWGIDPGLLAAVRRIFIAMAESKEKTTSKANFTD
jgi:hypothetical protein